MNVDKSLKFFAGASVFACAVIACSGATPDDVIAPPGSSQFGNDPADSGSSSSSTSGKDSGSPGTQGNQVDSGNGFLADAGNPQPVDSGSPTSTSSTYCGSALTCSGTSPNCCGEYSATPGNPYTFVCSASGQCAGATVSCRDESSCKSGQVCCGDRDPTNGYKSLECKSTNDCTPDQTLANSTVYRMCNPNAATDECQALGIDWQCTPSTVMPGFGFCDNGT